MAMINRKILNVFLAAALGAAAGAFLTLSGHLPVGQMQRGSNPLDLNNYASRLALSGILWTIFWVYWGIASRNSAATEKSESQASTTFHQLVLAFSLLLLLIPVTGLTARFLPQTAFLVIAGLLIQIGGMLLAVWARRHLGRNWSGEVRIAVDHQLIRTGPYRSLRHPIYTAMLGMFLGSALITGQIHSLVALAILTAAYWRKSRREEEILRENFGVEYDAYCNDTWALVPLLY